VGPVPEYESLPELHLIGLRVAGKPTQLGKLVPKGWKELQGRLAEIEGVKNPSQQIGFLLPNDHILALGRIATYIGVEVDASTPEIRGLKRHTLPTSRYAKFEYHGSLVDPAFAQFYPSIFKSMADNGVPFDGDLGWLERYDDATHHWDDKTWSGNILTVLFPLKP
jgi:predicted transcriptional regulator YdeE